NAGAQRLRRAARCAGRGAVAGRSRAHAAGPARTGTARRAGRAAHAHPLFPLARIRTPDAQCGSPGGTQLMSGGQPMQLPLGIKLRDEATFDNYYGGPNGTLVAALQELADPARTPEERCVYLWGAAGSGRSHLLQAACHRMAEAGALAMYLPLSELMDHGAQLLDGMEEVDLLCLDDLEVLAGHAEWE